MSNVCFPLYGRLGSNVLYDASSGTGAQKFKIHMRAFCLDFNPFPLAEDPSGSDPKDFGL